jgi:inner membrane protein
MPSPIGHALAGTAIALVAERVRASANGTTTTWAAAAHPLSKRPKGSGRLPAYLFLCVALAALPDADLLYQPIHRSVTHSLGSTLIVTIVAALVTGWVTGSRSIGVGLLCGIAWGSHTLLDWLGADPNPPRGIQALWPFSQQWFISGWDIFRGTERRQLLSAASMLYNVRAVAREVVVLAPIVILLVMLRPKPVDRGELKP